MKHEPIDCRQNERRATYITGTLKKGGLSNPCWVRDVSVGGALIFAEVPLSRGDRVVMHISDNTFAAYVRWVDYPLAGLQFETGSMVRGRYVAKEGPYTLTQTLRDRITNEHDGLAGRLRRWFGVE